MKINKYDYNYLMRLLQRGEDVEKIHYAFKENEDYNEEELNNTINKIEQELNET